MKLIILGFLLALPPAHAQLRDQPRVGRKAAQQYFTRSPASAGSESREQLSKPAQRNRSQDHYLSLQLGGYAESEAYDWAQSEPQLNVGKEILGVTYRLKEVAGSVDLMVRADLARFRLPDGNPAKLSLVPMVFFPESTAKFPLYFGVGAGPGVFLRQISRESQLSLDYQLVVGARISNVFGTTGLSVETGLKNHVHLLGSGQFNGAFLALGSVFIF